MLLGIVIIGAVAGANTGYVQQQQPTGSVTTVQTTPSVPIISAKLEATRRQALPQLKTNLAELAERNRSDLLIVINEDLFNKLIQAAVGSQFNAGGLFQVTVINPQVVIKNGLIFAHLQAQLKPTNALLAFTTTLDIGARLMLEQKEDQTIVAKFQVEELQNVDAPTEPANGPTNGAASSPTPSSTPVPTQTPTPLPVPAFTAEQLSGLLPPLNLPLTLDFDQTLRPATIKQTKPVAYELTIEPRRMRGQFHIVQLLPLNHRVALLARLEKFSVKRAEPDNSPRSRDHGQTKVTPNDFQSNNFQKKQSTKSSTKPSSAKSSTKIAPQPSTESPNQRAKSSDNQQSTQPLAPAKPLAPVDEQLGAQLDNEIEDLAQRLQFRTDKNIFFRVERRFLSYLAEQVAKASSRDLLIKLLPSRVLSTKSDVGFAKYDNYLDIESGDGNIDLRDGDVESIQRGRISCFLDLIGQVQARARGKQLGFDYTTTPQIGITLKDQIIFIIEPAGNEFRLRPAAKQLNARFDISVPIPGIGRDFNTTQNVPFDASSAIKPIPLPNVLNTELNLLGKPRKLSLSNTAYRAEDDRFQFEADITLQK